MGAMLSMSETILDLFNDDEQTVLSEIDKGILEKIQNLPIKLYVDSERIGEVVDE